ncbi:hypothetical protein [Paenibacillus fonticola]|uniref:hypothetical protein n=1 Tax=Paenibacillus fonticola TaxID=379896 RepID=UPI00037B749A|nr:hypothetical protein [Paenibacillus fonticola]
MFRLQLLILFIVLVLISACSSNKKIDHSAETIHVESEMTIAHSDLFPITGSHEFLSLRLVKGNYSEDWSPSPYTGRTWRGDFQLILSYENGKEISHIDLNNYFNNEELIFNDFFEFVFDDYNGDHEIDFTIGQYGTSNGNFYKIFTLTSDKQIQEVNIAENNELFVSGGNRYSIQLEKINNQSFKVRHYNNVAGQYIDEIYTSDGNKFNKNTNED